MGNINVSLPGNDCRRGGLGMKVTKAQVEANRAHIVDTACTLFRERGYDGVGVAELMATAGLTHGGQDPVTAGRREYG